MPEQLPLFPVEHTLILRQRPDGRIEARWHPLDLCATFDDWTLARVRARAITIWLYASAR
jgi:hypothetical protein